MITNIIQKQQINKDKASEIGNYILSCAILDDTITPKISSLQADWFYTDFQKKCIKYMHELILQNEPISLVGLNSKFQIDGQSAITNLAALTQTSVTSLVNIDYYIKELKKLYIIREAWKKGHELLQVSLDTIELQDITQDFRNKIDEIESQSTKSQVKHIEEFNIDIPEFIKNYNKITGIPTGFTGLDNILLGLKSNKLYIIAARPSLGKSALMGNIVENAVLNENKKVLVVGLEMTANEYIMRMVMSQTHTTPDNFYYQDKDKELTEFLNKLKNTNLYFCDNPSLNVLNIKFLATQLKQQKGLDVIALDYTQLVEGLENQQNRNAEISFISRQLKLMSRELDVVVIALSQLNREKQDGQVPQLRHLRDSGALEQDADIVIFLHCDLDYEEFIQREVIKIDLIVAKQRGGKVGKTRLQFNKPMTRFFNIENEKGVYK